jgi:small subunit ribosomal protein S1
MSDFDKDAVDPRQSLNDDLQREIEEALGDMSVQDLIDREEAASKPSTPGVRRGTVIAIQRDDIFVDMGGKSQGVLPAIQFEGKALPPVGSVVEVTITGYDSREGVLKLSRQGAVTAAAWQTIEEGSIVEGRVTDHNKGGLEMIIDGIKAFMPISQVERGRTEELAPYVGRRLKCMVTEVRQDERSVIVSRREVLDLEAAEAAKVMFETLVEGQIVTGTVKTIMPYGAFVDIGGMDGLLHIKDMGYTRVEKPEDVVHTGDQLQLMVLKIDREARKVGLGLKQVMPDPWADVPVKYPAESLTSGRITRLEGFGAFVELEPGVEGLIPISELTFERRLNHPSEVVKVGDVTRVRVLSVDMERKRISLSSKRVGDDPWTGASARWPQGSTVTGTVRRLTDFGAFVELTPGVEGLIHISELSRDRVRMVSDVVREGQTVQAKVVEVDEDRRRISLSMKQLLEDAEYTGEAAAAEPQAPAEPAKPAKPRKKPLKGGLDWKF